MSNNQMEHFLESTIQILPWIQDILENGALDKPRETTVTSISTETLSNLSATSSTQRTTSSLGKTLNFKLIFRRQLALVLPTTLDPTTNFP